MIMDALPATEKGCLGRFLYPTIEKPILIDRAIRTFDDVMANVAYHLSQITPTNFNKVISVK